MKKFLLGIALSFLLLFAFTPATLAQGTEEFSKAIVTDIFEEGDNEVSGNTYPYQRVRLEIIDGTEAGKKFTLDHGANFKLTSGQRVKAGQTVILAKTQGPEGEQYQIVDSYRLDKLGMIFGLFLVLVIALTRFKGLGSVLGLGVSILIIIKFVVPQIIAGRDPLTISIIGSFAVMLATMYLAHGVSKKTNIALFATFTTLTVSGVLAYVFVQLTRLSGLGGEDAYALQFGQTSDLNFQGLLLGGIIIGSLGVLDDITTSQTASIFELAKVNPNLKFMTLVKSGFNIGQEHIASLVNTLVLAYAGTALPVFIFFVLNPSGVPVWLMLNSELVAEEIVRTLAGSIGLVLAVPLTTLLAAWFASRKAKS